MNSRDDIVYFLMGAGVGAAMGLLLAPRSGTETRGMIQSKAQEGTDYVKRTAADTADLAKEAAQRVKKTFSNSIGEAAEVGRQAYREATALQDA